MTGLPRTRRRINPALRATVRASGRPGWQLALIVGITHHAKFSALINADTVPATSVNVERLHRIADAVGFSRDDIFLDIPAPAPAPEGTVSRG